MVRVFDVDPRFQGFTFGIQPENTRINAWRGSAVFDGEMIDGCRYRAKYRALQQDIR
jgi:hypothetical protein